MGPVTVRITRLPHHDGLDLPQYQTAHAAGVDLQAAIDDSFILEPLQRVLVPTGIAVAIPEGFEGQVRPRSGLAIRHGLSMVNTPGTIDADYRGEVSVALINLSNEPIRIERAMRIAQFVLCPVAKLEWQVVSDLPETDRGSGGFGHTGQ